MKLHTRENNLNLYFIAATFSILLSFAGFYRTFVINPDGICYIQSAKTIPLLGLNAAMHLCGQAQWPFYSILIYALTVLTKFSAVSSAYILNGIFSIISVVTFIYIVRLLGASQRVLWLAAATILLAHEFNSVREYIIRDHGFWAFYLLSIAFLIRYLRELEIKYALLWWCSLAVAILFRIEGVIFILFVPFVSFFASKTRLKSFFQLNLMTFLLALSFSLFMLLHHKGINTGRFGEIHYQLVHGIGLLINSFNAKVDALTKYVLSVFSARDAKLILFLLLINWYMVCVFTNVSLIYGLLVIYAWWKKLPKLNNPEKIVLFGYLAINVVITAAFLTDFMFLSKRYLVALSLILMFWVPFALDNLLNTKRKWLLILITLLMIANSLGGIFEFGYSKKYLKTAGLWLKDNVSNNENICSNDYQVMFYSEHLGNEIFDQSKIFIDLSALANNKWQQCDFVALHAKKKDVMNLKNEIESKNAPLKVFSNKRGDSVTIYKIVRGDKV